MNLHFQKCPGVSYQLNSPQEGHLTRKGQFVSIFRQTDAIKHYLEIGPNTT